MSDWKRIGTGDFPTAVEWRYRRPVVARAVQSESEAMVRFYVEFRDGGGQAAAYAETFDGSVESAVHAFGEAANAALIDVPDERRVAMETALQADENP